MEVVRRDEITRLLQAAHDGDPEALDRLAPHVYAELKRLARTVLRRDGGLSLHPTALVHEAWIKLVRQDTVGFAHRAQFFSAAATWMRRILVDHARARRSKKRGGGAAPEPFDETVAALEQNAGDLVVLGEALEELARVHPRHAKLVELRFFLGMEMGEAARLLSVSTRQAERDWALARAWLRGRLEEAPGRAP